MFRTLFIGLILALLSLPIHPQTSSPPKNHRILVSDVKISGVRAIGTDELESITGTLTGKIFDDEEEITQRLRFAFQDNGYFASQIDSVRVRSSDALADPKPVTIEAVVTEGPRFKMGELRFTGNHAISSEELKSAIPVKKGELFSRSKISSGLEALRVLYSKLGYINFTPLPNTEVQADSINLNIDIDEGRQYRLGSVEFVGNSNLADKLRSRWAMENGQPFDESYVNKFLNENASLLPFTFTPDHAVKAGRDCPSGTVNLLINLDPERPPESKPKEVPCENPQKPVEK